MAKRRKIKKKKLSPILQILNISKAYPDLVIRSETKNDNYYVVLRIKPTETSIAYDVKLVASKSYKPMVFIIKPTPKRLFDGLEKIPHVYSKKEARICLFYGKEITLDSDYTKIVPWISEWLFHFEIWKITGKWCGGGHTIRQKELIDF